jgi:hypothetical protein
VLTVVAGGGCLNVPSMFFLRSSESPENPPDPMTHPTFIDGHP